MLRITSRDPQPPPLAYIEASGGLFLDMTIHDFDMARFLMGKEVCEVFARGSALVDPAIGRAGDVDTATVSLRFAGGALGVIDNSRRAVYGYDQRVEILGARGMVRADNPPAHSAAVWDENGAHAAALKHFFIARYARAYVAEMEAFCRAVANQEPFPVDGKDGRRAVMLAHAAQRSLVERRPVAIEEMT
jgi:myo-inositol 2-dehydrogenase/D-chiro-inositol 1-dehydrogenase